MTGNLKHLASNLRYRTIGLILGSIFAAVLLAACGTDFVEPVPVGARSETPVPQATVLRVIPVTPVATATALPQATGPDGSIQRNYPPEIDPSRSGTGLPFDVAQGFWTEYLTGARLTVAGRPIDVHVCGDETLLPASESTFVKAGIWGLKPTLGEWYEVILGREINGGRIAGFVRLSRVGTETVSISENGELAVVSVTDSDRCGQIGDL